MYKTRTQSIFRFFGSLITLLSLLIAPIQPVGVVLAEDPPPHIDVWVDTNTVSGYQWPNGASMTLTVVDSQNGTYQPAPQTFLDYVQFQLPETFPLRPGQQITLTDGTTPRTTTVANLPAPVIDVANSQISGMTDPNATVWIWLCNQDGCVNRWITADLTGFYLFDFMAGEGTHIHLYPGDRSSVNVADGNGNNTSRSWRIPNPNLQASVNKRWVNARDWPIGQALTLSINGVPFETKVIGPSQWNPSDIVANFNPPVLHVGDVLTIDNADHSISKSLTLSPVKLTDIQFASSTLTGIAMPNSVVEVGVDVPNSCIMRRVTADAQGIWTAAFAEVNNDPGNCGSAVFGPGIKGWATNYDVDRDSTLMNWEMPHLDVFLDRHTVSAYNWAVGMDLTLTITQPLAQPYITTVTNGSAVDETVQGYTQYNLPPEVLLTPGQQVTVSDGVISQTTTIQDLLPPTIDQALSRLSGSASPGAQISTCLTAVWPCIPRSVTVGAGGIYTLDFSTPGPNPGEQQTRALQPNDGGALRWRDSLGNHTALNWHIAAHTLHVNPLDQEIHGHDWPLGVEVTLTLDDPSTGAHKTATTTVVSLPNQCGEPCFWMDDMGWTLAPGQVIQMSEGISSKTVTVSPLRTTRIDALHDLLVGKAGPNSPISVGESTMGIGARWLESDANGDWSVDFSVPGPNGETNTLDLNRDSHGRVLQINPPGWGQDDGTLQYWSVIDPMILSAAQIDENAPAGSVVGTFSPTYPEVTQALVYSLVTGEGDADNTAFTIDGTVLKLNASPNFENQAAYSIRVRVVDTLAPGKSYETTYAISVIDVDEPATQISLSPNTLIENSPAGSSVGTLAVNDPDAGEIYSYSLVSGAGSSDNTLFTITGSTLHIKAMPDYETQSSYSIRVRAAPGAAPDAALEQVVSITITNQLEAPSLTSFSKTGPQYAPIPFTAADFSEHYANLESADSGGLVKIKITSLPAHGVLKVGATSQVVGSEIESANLGLLVYQPEVGFTGSDAFGWTGADSSGYTPGSAQVFLTIGTVIRPGVQISPAGDAQPAKAGTNAVYSLTLTNTGSHLDSYTLALMGSPRWTMMVAPTTVIALAAGAQTTLTVTVAIPMDSTGSDEAILQAASWTDASKTDSIRLTTTAVGELGTPYPVLLSVSPASVYVSALFATPLTLAGANFTQPMTVRVGGQSSSWVTRQSSVALTAALPDGLLPGVYDVQVCDAADRCASLPDAFTVLDQTPALTGVYPRHGHNDSDHQVTVRGYNLSTATTFTLVGAGPEQQPTAVQETGSVLHFTIPAGLKPGTYDLRACNLGSCATLPSAYTALVEAKNDFGADVGDLWTSPITVREGNSVTIGLNVNRLSGLGLAAAQVAFYRDDPTIPANKISPATNPSTVPLASGGAEAVTVTWNPVGVTGAVKIYAVIDPEGLLSEATRANNVVSTTVQILPREVKDDLAPVIQAFRINGGSGFTGQTQVNLAIQAAEAPDGSGLQGMAIVERIYNPAARQWIAAQATGWIPYKSSYQLNLTGQGGQHYLQIWVADKAGNTSSLAQTSINYQPEQEAITAGQARIYRVERYANTTTQINLQTLAGDADLYVWDPDGSLVSASSTENPLDGVVFTTRVSGVYQVEVYGFADASYAITFQAPAFGSLVSGNAAVGMQSAKPEHLKPSTPVQNEPLNSQPDAPAPVMAWRDRISVFLPTVVR